MSDTTVGVLGVLIRGGMCGLDILRGRCRGVLAPMLRSGMYLAILHLASLTRYVDVGNRH